MVASGGGVGGCWVGAEQGGGGGGAAEGSYFMGDSFERKSRREGSRSRRGSVDEVVGEVLFQSQPILRSIGKWESCRGSWLSGARSGGRCQAMVT